MKDLYRQIAVIVLIVAGLNMGIYGLIGIDFISTILGHVLGRLIYIVVGVAAGYKCYLYYLAKFKKTV